MKKRLISIIFAFSLIFTFFVGCSETKLEVPDVSFSIQTETVSWQEVVGAKTYEIKVNDSLFVTENCYFSFSSFQEGEYAYCVRACSSFSNSDYSQILIYEKTSNPNVDYTEIINGVALKAMKFNVYIEHRYTINGSSKVSTGSGVIIKKETSLLNNATYYILTNFHVVNTLNSINNSYSVYDYCSNALSANVLHLDKNYDLAILQATDRKSIFSNTSVANISTETLNIGKQIISLGQPLSQKNTFTIGKIKGISEAPTTDSGKLPFNVISHNAYIDHGSSGGALLDLDFNLIGINYAGSINSDTEKFYRGYAIPIEQVLNFFESVNWSVA